jgi:hypothetical protein
VEGDGGASVALLVGGITALADAARVGTLVAPVTAADACVRARTVLDVSRSITQQTSHIAAVKH